MAIDWGKIIPAGIGVGATLLGSKLTADAANQSSQREWDLIQQEMARRNAIQGALAPTIGHALGMRNPATLSNFQQTLSGSSSGYPGTTGGGGGGTTEVPQAQSSAVSGGLKGAGLGLGIASAVAPKALGAGFGALGLGGAAIPVVGGILGAGALAASQIGKGRRTANVATGEGGFEKQFTDALTKISAGQGTLQDLDAAYNQYLQNAQAWIAMGGTHKKVAEQSLYQNEPLQNTYKTLRRQLGG